MTGAIDALEWVRENGVVLQSARGRIPNLAEYVAGEPIKGSWWGHPAGHKIYDVLNEVTASPEVVTTRLIDGKLTLIHRWLWPALVRLGDRFPAGSLASVQQEHTASGAHRNIEVPFPEWVPASDVAAAASLTAADALHRLPACLRERIG